MDTKETMDAIDVWEDKGYIDPHVAEAAKNYVMSVGDGPRDFVVSKFNNRGIKVAWRTESAVASLQVEPA